MTGEKDGKPEERLLVIGAEVPASASTLVRVDDRTDAYVVDGVFFSQVTRAAGDWRDKRLFTGSRDAIQRVTLRGAGPRQGGEPVVLARHGEELRLESPIVDRADHDKVDRLLGDLTSLVGPALHRPPRPSAGRARPRPAAGRGGGAASTAAPSPSASSWGHRPMTRRRRGAPAPPPASVTGDRYGRADGQLFVVATPLGEAVERPAAEWQAPALSALSLYQIEKATIERGGKKLTLARDGTEWKRGDDKVPYTPVSELFYALTGAHADRFLRRAEARADGAALDAPSLIVSLETAGPTPAATPPRRRRKPPAGEATEILTLYPPDAALGGGVPATASGRDFVLLLPKDAADKIFDKLDRLEKAEPVKPEPVQPEPTSPRARRRPGS